MKMWYEITYAVPTALGNEYWHTAYCPIRAYGPYKTKLGTLALCAVYGYRIVQIRRRTSR